MKLFTWALSSSRSGESPLAPSVLRKPGETVKRWVGGVVVPWLGAGLLLGSWHASGATVSVAAASSLRSSVGPLVEEFRRKHDGQYRVIYAATGTLIQQLMHGAPYSVFLSASSRYIEPLERSGRICEGPTVIGHGRLVLYVPRLSKLRLDATLESLAASPFRHLAIANPDIAPFGLLARQALQQAGVWEAIQQRLVFSESAASSARLALSGGVDAALLPERLMSAPIFAKRGRWVRVDDDLYRPLPMMAVWICGGSVDSRSLYRFLVDRLVR